MWEQRCTSPSRPLPSLLGEARGEPILDVLFILYFSRVSRLMYLAAIEVKEEYLVIGCFEFTMMLRCYAMPPSLRVQPIENQTRILGGVAPWGKKRVHSCRFLFPPPRRRRILGERTRASVFLSFSQRRFSGEDRKNDTYFAARSSYPISATGQPSITDNL